MVEHFSVVPYEVTVHTGDLPEAGTDSKIFMTVFGERGTSKTLELEKIENYFERDQVDTLKVSLIQLSFLT